MVQILSFGLVKNKWKKVILRGEVTSIEPPDGEGIEAWPLVRFKNSDVRVFIGRPEKKDTKRDLTSMREELVGKTVAFRSEVFPNSNQLAAILPLNDKGKPELQDGVQNPEMKKFQDPVKLGVKISYAWMYPITCLLTVGCGILGGLLIGKKE